MNPNWTKLNEVFQDIFEDDDIELSETTTAKDIEEWDSMMHVSLMIAVEQAFDVKFSASEIAMLNTVGELMALIEKKKAS